MSHQLLTVLPWSPETEDHIYTFSIKGHSSLQGGGMHRKNFCPPWIPGHAQASLISALISPNSWNITGLALLNHSLLCVPDALVQTGIPRQKKDHLLYAVCMHGLSQDATSYDFHLDIVHVLCNQAESRKVICNEGIVSIYRMH